MQDEVTDKGNTPDSGDPVTTIVSWKVQRGAEKQFEAWRHKIDSDALKFPGHMGINTITPTNGSREYTVIFRFDTYEHFRAWEESDIRRNLMKEAKQFQDAEPIYRTDNSLAFWFETPAAPTPPPKWKMSVVTLLGVWPISMLVPVLLHPFIANLPRAFASLVVAAGIVCALSWVVMPILAKIFHSWLHSDRNK